MIRRFVEVAERFCSVIDRIQKLTEIEFLRQIDVLLPRVYSFGLDLPEVGYEIDQEDGPESVPIGTAAEGHHERWKQLCARIENKLGRHTWFRHVHDPADPNDQEVCVASLADELAEVYIGLRDGLDLYSSDAPPSESAVQRWRVALLLWPNSAKDAIAAVYALVHCHYDEDDEVFDI